MNTEKIITSITDNAIKVLAERASNRENTADEALKFTQSVLNLAHSKSILSYVNSEFLETA